MELLYIHWNPDPILFSIAGIAIRWYSIFWFIAILAGSQVVYKLYQSKGLPVDTFQNLFLYSFLGIFIGARLGHCLFYEPDYYLSHPLEIVLPVHFYPDGDWKFTGFIRLANLMNSEIIGLPADVPWAFVFEREDMLPRHPAQLYEAIAYFLFFLIMVGVARYKKDNYGRGFYFGLCITLIFLFRFFIEFLKERQVDFENVLPIDMGQILSIPFVLLGLYFVITKRKKAVR